MPFPIVARLHLLPALEARRAGRASAPVSLDLNRSRVELPLSSAGIALPGGGILSWNAAEKIAKKDDNCFVVHGSGAIEPVHRFSPAFNRSYTLRATAGAPTLLVAGFPMHRIKDITPDGDTQRKMEAIGTLTGDVLDTTTGLGYATIAAARQGAVVTTIELDPVVIEIASLNPWSEDLFDNPSVRQITGSAFDRVRDLDTGRFTAILHDPPTVSLAGDLYSLAFYEQAYRVLRPGGKMFHYIGDLQSRQGKLVAPGVERRLRDAGFRRVDRHPAAFALVAWK